MEQKKNRGIIRGCLLFIIICGIFISLAGCSDLSAEEEGAEEKLKIVTTIFPPYDFAKQIAGDKADVSMLLPPGAESHSFEPSPQDILKIQNSDIFIFTGGESDKWIEEILDSINRDDMNIIRLMECVEIVEEELAEGMEGHSSHEHEAEYDEHVWTSPENAILITEEISKQLSELDGENSEYYRERTEGYKEELNSLSQSFREIAENGVRSVMVFGDRFPFRYFTDEYGLSYHAAFPGCSSETEPSVATLAYLINFIKENKIPKVFYLESSNKNIAEMLCEATGAEPLLFHSCHNLSQKEMEQGRTYIDIMEENVKNLKEALN